MAIKQLPITPEAEADPRARELLRVWAAEKKEHVTIATELWDDPACWGIMLVDLAKHIAHAYQLTRGDDQQSVLGRIRAGFDAEWMKATDEPSGELLN